MRRLVQQCKFAKNYIINIFRSKTSIYLRLLEILITQIKR